MKFIDLKVLSDHEINMVHEASVNILENTGIKVGSKRVLDLLNSKGAIVDYNTEIAKLPRSLVEKCINIVPKAFDMYDRNGNKAFTIGDSIPKCASGHEEVIMSVGPRCNFMMEDHTLHLGSIEGSKLKSTLIHANLYVSTSLDISLNT